MFSPTKLPTAGLVFYRKKLVLSGLRLHANTLPGQLLRQQDNGVLLQNLWTRVPAELAGASHHRATRPGRRTRRYQLRSGPCQVWLLNDNLF